jgi:uncharacterized protein YbjT (DUF2867 family)
MENKLKKTAALIGATGMVGSNLLRLLVNNDEYKGINLLLRRDLDFENEKIKSFIVDFTNEADLKIALSNCDVLFCAIGTTQKKVGGDKSLYKMIDYDIPLRAAHICKVIGCEEMVLVSAIGANSKSKNFYLSLKGSVEDSIAKVGLKKFHVMRPSLLIGKREEFRLGEKISMILINRLNFLLPTKYKGIKAEDVAKSMIAVTNNSTIGKHIYEYNDMMNSLK